jgi:DNA polymerase-3 subunit epsilon
MSGEAALKRLLDTARPPAWKICAENAAFELKESLKARGYRWNGGGDGGPRAWWTEVTDAQREEEISFLRKDIYGYEADVVV